MISSRKKVLIACLSDPSWNPRPFRVIWLLNQMGYEVWSLSPQPRQSIPGLHRCISFTARGDSFFERIYIRLLWKIWRYTSIVSFAHSISEYIYVCIYGINRHKSIFEKSKFDLIIIEDLPLLNYILDVVRESIPVVYDAREYAPLENESNTSFMKFDRPRIIMSLKKGIPRLDGFITVCDSLAEKYKEEYGTKPMVVRSTPFFNDIHPGALVGRPIKMVHHGNANTDRGLSKMIDVVKKLNGRYNLDMYLVGDNKNISDLVLYACGCPFVRFLEPVKFNEIIPMLSSYDIGFYLLQPTGFNTLYSLPNKLFEFIQARLAVVIGPSPEMASIVVQYACGAVSNDFSVDSMVDLLDSLKPIDIVNMKKGSSKAAESLCWQEESKNLEELLKTVKLNKMPV
jgi:hypothetical protein